MVKPTDGMAGRGIMLLRSGDPNVRSILEVATTRGRDQVVVQRFQPQSVVQGDRRVIVLDSAPIGVVRRVATSGDFRRLSPGYSGAARNRAHSRPIASAPP